MRRTPRIATLLAASAVLLAACGDDAPADDEATTTTEAAGGDACALADELAGLRDDLDQVLEDGDAGALEALLDDAASTVDRAAGVLDGAEDADLDLDRLVDVAGQVDFDPTDPSLERPAGQAVDALDGLAAEAAAACDGGGSGGDDDDSTTTTEEVTTTTEDTTTTEAAAGTLTIENFEFGEVTVAAGAEVTVENLDSTPHTVAPEDDAFDEVQVDGGRTETFTAPSEPGSYEFRCGIHSSMQGTLVVE